MTKKLDFKGDGFSSEDFTPDERAKMRERSHHYDRHFLSTDEFLRSTGLKWLADVGKGFPAFVRAFAVIGTIAGGYAALKLWGLL